jgi:hypothetical protein
MTSNTVVNLNKVRAANKNKFVGAQVLVFDYFAPESENGDVEQRPIVRVVPNSLRQTKDGEWIFAGVNLYRVDDNDRGVRTYRLSRINGVARKP